MALLEVEKIRRCFGGLVAVDQVSFEVAPGEVKSVIGPNGAGKTTVFNLISGMLRPQSGQVRFRGQEITGLKPYQISRAGISRTFQNPSLFLRMSVLENVMVGRHQRSRSGFWKCGLRWPSQRREEEAIREAAICHLENVGLRDLADRSAGSLAFGQRRMVELARALATEPDLLLLDEPASGLNTREKDELNSLIRGIRERGITILLVEHDMTLVMDVSDDILVLNNGTPIAEGPPSVIQNDPRVIAIYLGGTFQHAAASHQS
jgi:branched-chain amino acid transport system ATP-binding protein